MGVRRRRVFVLALASATVLVTASCTAAAWAYDHAHAGTIMPGVAVGDVAVGGLTRTAALAAVQRTLDPALDAPVTIQVGSFQETVTARQLGTTTDARTRVDAALESPRGLAFPARVYHRLTGSPVRTNEPVHRVVDTRALRTYVDGLAQRVFQAPVNAAIDTSDGFVHITPDHDGFHIDAGAATKALRSALVHGAHNVVLSGETVAPSTHAADLGLVLLVRVGENKLYVYRNGQVERTFDVATGMARYPTPLGQFKVVSRLRNPTWVNPAKYRGGWGYAMPARIGPGRANPLGTRALALNAPGVLIHGTSNNASIGFNASHGCIRMRMPDIESLFDEVPAGAPVVILRAAPDRVAGHLPAGITEPDVVAGTTAAAPDNAPADQPPSTTTTTSNATVTTTAPPR